MGLSTHKSEELQFERDILREVYANLAVEIINIPDTPDTHDKRQKLIDRRRKVAELMERIDRSLEYFESLS